MGVLAVHSALQEHTWALEGGHLLLNVWHVQPIPFQQALGHWHVHLVQYVQLENILISPAT